MSAEDELWRLRNIEIDLERTKSELELAKTRIEELEGGPNLNEPLFLLNKLTVKIPPPPEGQIPAAIYSHQHKTVIGSIVTDSLNIQDCQILMDDAIPPGEVHIITGHDKHFQQSVTVHRRLKPDTNYVNLKAIPNE